MTIPTSTRLGAYEITALFGAGAMGEVYRRFDPLIERVRKEFESFQ